MARYPRLQRPARHPAPRGRPARRASVGAARSYEIISDEELLAQLRDRPILVVRKENGSREIVLLANEWLDAVAIDESREESARAGKRHGEVLVANGLLTPEQLRATLLVQHGENLAAFLRLSAGTYEWRGSEPPPSWAREVLVDPIAAIVDALARPTLLSRRRRILDWLGPHVLRLNAEWPEIDAKSALRDEERQAIAKMQSLFPEAEVYVILPAW